MNDNNAKRMKEKEEERDTLLEKIAGLVRRLGRREGGASALASAEPTEAAGEGEPTGVAAGRHHSQSEPTEAAGEGEPTGVAAGRRLSQSKPTEAAGKGEPTGVAAGRRLSQSKPTEGDAQGAETAGKTEEKEGACCRLPMVIKRNIVNSIEEVRRFAEEHELAVTAVESVLGMILEVAVGCAEGKVSRQMLLWALRVLNYERDKAEARRKGELDGRNAAIEERYFRGRPEDVPYLTSGTDTPLGDEQDEDDIFEMARSARSAKR